MTEPVWFTAIEEVWLDGVQKPRARAVEFLAGFTVDLNPDTGRLEIGGGGGGGSGHTIEDEGTPLTARTSLNFVGVNVSVADSGGKTVVTIGAVSLAGSQVTGTLPVARGGTGLGTLGTPGQSYRVNDAGTAIEWYNAVPTVLDWKQSVRVATTANISLTGEQTIDGVLTSADRILVKNQSTGSQNGIYVTGAGAWTRATDADLDAEVTAGLTVAVEEGTANAGRLFVLTTADPIVVNTTSLTFTLLTAGGDLKSDGTVALAGTWSLGNQVLTNARSLRYNAVVDNGNSGAADTIDLGAGDYQRSTLTGNATLTITAPPAPCSGVLELIQDATGSRTVTFSGASYTSGAPFANPTPSSKTFVPWYYDGTTVWLSAQPGPPAAVALGNASVTRHISDGSQFVVPPGTLATSAKTLTLGTSGTPEVDEMIEVVVYSQSQNQVLANGGPLANTLYTVVAGTKRVLHAKWNGADWVAAGKMRLA